MATVEQGVNPLGYVPPKVNYLNNGYGLKSWLLTKDHKRIAVLYMISISIFFALGGFLISPLVLEIHKYLYHILNEMLVSHLLRPIKPLLYNLLNN